MRIRFRAVQTWAVTAAVGAAVLVAAAHREESGGQKPSPEQIKQQRKEAARRQRRIIVNNDGNDARTPPDEPRTHENFLGKRTSGLAGSQVDALFYCSGVFNLYTHHSRETEPRTRGDKNVIDWAWELGNHGPDTLATVVRFGHQHGMEVFWSMRMNDTHDSADPALLCRWKKEHPDWLMGKRGDKYRAGGRRWSAVNYAVPEVREKVFRILADVAARYDVDGLELDFFRHPIYFQPQMFGKPVTQEQCDLLTDLMRRVRRMTDGQAEKRGRPLLIAVRVPDSVEYCRGVGLDLVRWMEEDLIDLLVVGGYFQLNPWERSVALGHKYGVPVYPSLSEPRFRDPEAQKPRRSAAGYRGRALAAWAAGADGVYPFNLINDVDPKDPLWRELGDPKVLLAREHLYAAGPLSMSACNYWLAGGLQFSNLPAPLPERPVTLKPGAPATVELRAGFPPSGNPAREVTARLRFRRPPADAAAIKVHLNGQPLSHGKKSGNWLEYPVRPVLVQKGVNRFEIELAQEEKSPRLLQDLLLIVRPGGQAREE